MIHFIHGTLSDVAEGLVVVEAAGVGYGIHVPASVIGALPPIGEDIKIYTYFSLTQNGVDLYGFLSPEDRAMFTMLLMVSGIGPKGALGILSALPPDDLRMAIVTGDSKAISRAPGVGNKTAQRVVLE
ncbi:MAG: Holliday junction branch migration protein RuvA, partial [Oribacterium sp.]|nr:Holliday junction branch migration protein RuvA [Oribacterium sp.]